MQVEETGLKDCYIINPQVFGDSRGYFFESYNSEKFQALTGIRTDFVQDNQSYSGYGVIRGLHAQSGEYAQAKLVRVLKGEVLDVAVDIRPGSPSYGQHVSVVLSAENRKQLFVPRGFLHGFAVLSEDAEFFYKCDNLYHKPSEVGVRFNDMDLGIDWKIPSERQVISDKDRELPGFKKLVLSPANKE